MVSLIKNVSEGHTRDLEQGANLGVVISMGEPTAEGASANDQAQSTDIGFLVFCQMFSIILCVCALCIFCIRLVRLYPEEWFSIVSIVMTTVAMCWMCRRAQRTMARA
jgi:Flp pilus assembly protein TadB